MRRVFGLLTLESNDFEISKSSVTRLGSSCFRDVVHSCSCIASDVMKCLRICTLVVAAPTDAGSSSLSTGAVAGIAVGGVIVLAVGVTFLLLKFGLVKCARFDKSSKTAGSFLYILRFPSTRVKTEFSCRTIRSSICCIFPLHNATAISLVMSTHNCIVLPARCLHA